MRRRFLLSGAALLAVVLAGTAGYRLIEGWSLFDALYMTIITVATVGYGETHPLSATGRVFTLFLILGGISLLTYAFSTLTAFLVEGELHHALRRRRMEKKIESLNGHFIVCGGGRTGRHVADELTKTQRDFVVVDRNVHIISEFLKEGTPALAGDADQDDTLRRAGIDRARGLIACLPTDQENLFAVITARGLNPKLRIVSKAVQKGVEEKLLRSGADAVVSPHQIGGLRMASELVRPAVVSFLDKMLRDPDGSLRIEEVPVGSASVGKTLEEAVNRRGLDVLVLAVKSQAGADYAFNPKPPTALAVRDVLVVMGRAEEVRKLQESMN